MANKVISMLQIRTVLQLLEKGYSLRAITSQLGMSRQVVTLYAARLKKSRLSFEALRQLPDIDIAAIVYRPSPVRDYSTDSRRQDLINLIPYYLTELTRTGVTRLLLWQEYCLSCDTPYRYTQFCTLLKDAAKKTKATMHLEHVPAATVMIDFAGDKMSYTDLSTGELIMCPVLICVLPFSKYSFAMALPDATIPQVIKALNSCMLYFGGVPLSLKTDNMKQIVTKSCRYEPVFSEAMKQWALHYNITLLATRVARPKDKAAVENEVKIAYQRLYAPLRDKIYHSLAALNVDIRTHLDLHNAKILQLKDYSRLQLFNEQEQSLLQSLPTQPYILKHRVSSKVQKNYHITLGENYHHYSAPYYLIGKQLTVVYDTDIVEIYYQHQRVALHTRSYRKHGFTTTGDHMPSGHQQFFEQRGWTPTYFLEQATKIGPNVNQYMNEVLKSRAFTEQTYNACRGILRLHKEYATCRLEAACTRALSGSVFNYRTLQNILLKNLDRADQINPDDLFSLPHHANLRGPEAYQ